MNQHPVPAFDSAQVNQRIICGDIHRCYRSRFGHTETLWLAKHVVFIDDHPIRNAPALGKQHLISNLNIFYAGTDPPHRSAGFHPDFMPQHRAFVGQPRQQLERHHNVAEIERRVSHFNLDVTVSQAGHFIGFHLQPRDLPGIVHRQPIRVRFADVADQGISVAQMHQPRRPKLTVSDGDFALADIVANQPGESVQICAGADVNQRESEFRCGTDLLVYASYQSPQRGVGWIAHINHRILGDNIHSAFEFRLKSQERIDQCLNQLNRFCASQLTGGIVRMIANETVNGQSPGQLRQQIFQESDCIVDRIDQICGTVAPLNQAGPLRGDVTRISDHQPKFGPFFLVFGFAQSGCRLQQRHAVETPNDCPSGTGRYRRIGFV